MMRNPYMALPPTPLGGSLLAALLAWLRRKVRP